MKSWSKEGYTAIGLHARVKKEKPANLYSGEFGVNNQLFFCGIPFRLDSYSGCSFMCSYCFARTSELTNASNKNRQVPILVANPSNFKRFLAIALDQGLKRADINIEWLRARVPIHWGGMSDPFQACEEKYKVSSQWLDYINWYQYPVAISTKSDMILEPEYLNKLKEGNYAVQISLVNDNDEMLKQLEPGAPSGTRRLEVIKTLADNGIHVIVRIQPLIPNSIIEYNLPSFIEKLAKAGARHVLTEGYKVQTRNIKGMNYIYNLFPDMYKAYKTPDTILAGFELLLPSWRKWKYIKVARQACHDNGITYGAADNDMRDFGDVVCCCGLDNIPGFENFWRYQASQAAVLAKENGTVSLEDMQQYWSGGTNIMSGQNQPPEEEYKRRRSEAKIAAQDGKMRRNARSKDINVTAKYCVDYMWNTGGECSPEVMASMTKDPSSTIGNMVYKWKDPTDKLEQSNFEQPSLL